MNRNVEETRKLGQSFWLDNIDRSLVEGPELGRLVREHGIRGLTSNPAIFEKAITGSSLYDEQLRELVERKNPPSVTGLFEELALRDIRGACDTLRAVYDETGGADGFASFEVTPWYARDAERTMSEARRLWAKIDRPNAMIKVPGTPECVPAIRQLLAEGININITLLFSRENYEAVLFAWLEALEERVQKGLPVESLASVASFFVSRIDAAVDKQLTDKSLAGHAAIDNAKLAYARFREVLEADRWRKIEELGARPQRLLWASTSVKNPKYPDTLYVDSLIGPLTVNTMPLATLRAFEDHGTARPTIGEDVAASRERLERLERSGVSLRKVTDQLLDDAIRLFSEPFDQLLGSLERKRRRFGTPLNTFRSSLPPRALVPLGKELERWAKGGNTRRLWNRDSTLWTGTDEDKWLDWLELPEPPKEELAKLLAFRDEMKKQELRTVLVLGMGGSSLAPEVLGVTLPKDDGAPWLTVLDSTDPGQIHSLRNEIDPARTLFIVSSKSGTTLEPNLFLEYFWSETVKALGSEEAAAKRFVAVTDPWSALEKTARDRRFAHLFPGLPGVGGRYSALSAFGLVPAAAAGADIELLLANARAMQLACGPGVPPEENPGVLLGLTLGTLARAGRDKLTFVLSPAINDLGAWLEQLVAESTGKQGRGLIPVWGEALGACGTYGDDRIFVALSLTDDFEPAVLYLLAHLEEMGHPVLRIRVGSPYALAQEFFRWEIATAVAGAVIGINPFDQPDVEASKIQTKKLTRAFEETGAFPAERPFFEENGFQVFADERNTGELSRLLDGTDWTLSSILAAHWSRAKAGDYCALLAYLERDPDLEEMLQRTREELRVRLRVATCLGFGPRFLHSTGQAYKGGPNTGVFTELTCATELDIPVPGRRLTFGAVEAAQARGDFEVLAERGRRLLRVHLPADLENALPVFEQAVIDGFQRGREAA